MKLNNFEKYIKQQFSQAEEPVDVKALMQAIPVIQRKKRALWPFYLLGGLVVSAGVLTLFVLNSPNNSEITDQISVFETELASTETELATIPKESTVISLEDKDAANNKSHFKDLIVTKDKSLNEKGNTELVNRSKNEDIHSNHISNPSISTPSKQIPNIIEAINSENSKINNGQFLAISTNNSSKIEDNTINQSSISLSNNNNYTNIATEREKLHLKKSAYLTSFLAPPSWKTIDKNTGLLNITSLPQNVECPKFGSNPWIVEIGTVMGLSKPTKKLRNTTTTTINPALSSRSENEKSLEGLDLEFFISAKRARWPVFLRSGVNYSRWSERMKIDEQFTEIDTVQGIVSTTVSPSGDTITYIYGDIYITKDYDIKKDIHYYINRFDIPLSIAYEQTFGQHAIQAELGARMNITTFARGRIYNENSEFSDVKGTSVFKRITGVSYFGKAHYRYYLNQKYFVGSSLYYQFLPAEFSNGSSFSQKYTNFGIGIYAGMRF